MGVADEQIRVSETVKRKIERRRREGESYNDALERILDEEAERVSEGRRESKKERQRRMRERTENAA